MGRRLGKNVIHEIKLTDALCGEEISHFFKEPGQKKRVAYRNQTIQLKNRKVKELTDVKLKFILGDLQGVSDGAYDEEDGKPISSNPKSSNYKENWKELIAEFASDNLLFCADKLYLGSDAVEDEEEENEDFFDETSEQQTSAAIQNVEPDA